MCEKPCRGFLSFFVISTLEIVVSVVFCCLDGHIPKIDTTFSH